MKVVRQVVLTEPLRGVQPQGVAAPPRKVGMGALDTGVIVTDLLSIPAGALVGALVGAAIGAAQNKPMGKPAKTGAIAGGLIGAAFSAYALVIGAAADS